MRIDHIAAYVHDLEKTRAFYEDYFGASVNSQYHNPKTGLKTYFLSFGGDCRFEIMSRPNISKNRDNVERMGYIHLAFCAGDKASVDQLTNRLKKDGYIVFSEPRITGDGYYESCVSDPDGNQIEIVA